MIDRRTALWAALLLHVTLGSLFIAHMYWKFGHDYQAVWARGRSNFAANEISPHRPLVLHFCRNFGAVLLIAGIWTRWVALYALPLWQVLRTYWNARGLPVGTGSELPFVWSVIASAVGDGRICAWFRRAAAERGAFQDRLGMHRSPGHQVDGGSLAVILVVRSATRWLRLYGYHAPVSNLCNACSVPVHGPASSSVAARCRGQRSGECRSPSISLRDSDIPH